MRFGMGNYQVRLQARYQHDESDSHHRTRGRMEGRFEVELPENIRLPIKTLTRYRGTMSLPDPR